ncbi:MAG TPA: helix-turn-helix domain-containing protein, partial [Blastocatellia bacterium]|nr:helix-turn-helix domain-containing protein [Blastocatellia bacterium]
DVRFIAATNRDLNQDVVEGKFRSDLLFRINNFTIKLPALCERPEDIPALAEHFLGRVSGGEHARLSDDAMQVLMNYSWPGNVRELRNVIERAVILSTSNEIAAEDLPLELRTHRMINVDPDDDDESRAGSLDELRRKQILTVLEQTGWHQGKASEILGISPSTLYRQLKSYGLTRSRRLHEHVF